MILLFSGTGNSAMVARELRNEIGGEIVTLERDLLLSPASKVLEVPEGEAVVWVFPIYSWGVPPVVVEFSHRAKLKGGEQAKHFMVATCGDDIGFADSQWSKLVCRRGWNPRGAFSVQMPNTYVCMKGFDVDSAELAQSKIDAMPERVSEVAAAIKRGFSDSDVVRGSMAWLKTTIVYPFFKLFCMSPRQFKATAQCVGCGRCAESCPMGNITMSNVAGENKSGSPQWGNRCAFCLRCYHICPRHAVAYGDETLTKGQKTVSF
jgi:ferredoxin